MSRTQSIQQTVKTQWGKMYVHVEYTDDGVFRGAWISYRNQIENNLANEVPSDIQKLMDQLSVGLDKALRSVCERYGKPAEPKQEQPAEEPIG